MTLCFGLIQTNVMAAETKSGQTSTNTKLATIKDGTNARQDVAISETDKEAALSNKLSSADLLKKYGSKGSTKGSKLLNTKTASVSLDAVSSVSGKNKLSDSFYFVSGLYGGKQSLLNSSFGRESGCGPIAACNIFAYHAQNFGRSGLYPYSWTTSGWTNYQQDMYNIIGGVQNVTRFNSMVDSYASNHGYSYGNSYDSYYRNTDSNLTDMCNFIQAQIDNNNPVAMLIGTNMPNASYKTDFNTHWVTITGYTFWGNQADPYVRVSSWGDWYDLDLAELLAQRTWIDLDYLYEK